MNKLIAAFALVGFFVYVNPAWAEMTSTNYQINWDSFSQGGSDSASSTNYGLRDSVGGSGFGNATSDNYQTDSGYRAGVFDQVITFDTAVQNNSVSHAATGRSGLTVYLSSTSGFSIGDEIVLIQDRGASQVTAVGNIVSGVVNTSITVSSWSSNGTLPTIDGTNDFVYGMTAGGSAALGELGDTSVSTSTILLYANADLANGYTIQAMSDTGLTSGTHTITAVADGSVTAGSEEYGAISSDTSLANSTFDTQDSAITTSFQEVVTNGSRAFQDRHFLTLRASKAAATPSGTYAQTLTFIASGNF